MKTIVVETTKNGAVLLREDGTFEYSSRRGLIVGQTLELSGRLTSLRARRTLRALAACLALSMLLTGGALAYYAPYSTITVGDASPVVLTLNVFDHVIGAQGDDDEASTMARTLVADGILYKSAGDALDRALDRLDPHADNPLPSPESSPASPIPVSVDSVSDRHANELADRMGGQERPHDVDIRPGGPPPPPAPAQPAQQAPAPEPTAQPSPAPASAPTPAPATAAPTAEPTAAPEPAASSEPASEPAQTAAPEPAAEPTPAAEDPEPAGPAAKPAATEKPKPAGPAAKPGPKTAATPVPVSPTATA